MIPNPQQHTDNLPHDAAFRAALPILNAFLGLPPNTTGLKRIKHAFRTLTDCQSWLAIRPECLVLGATVPETGKDPEPIRIPWLAISEDSLMAAVMRLELDAAGLEGEEPLWPLEPADR